MAGALVLFTRDLRVHDHAPLSAAAQAAKGLVAAFVLDERLLRGSAGAPNRVRFLLDCLEDLDSSLRARGTKLVLRRGDPVREALALAREHDLDTIHLSADVTPYATRRLQRLARACAEQRIALVEHRGVTIAPPGSLSTASGEHYRVFTPYWRVWSALPSGGTHRTPQRLRTPGRLERSPVPRLDSLTRGSPSAGLQKGGESAARAQLSRWLGSGYETYESRHDELDGPETSRMSAYLHFGCVSPRTVLEAARAHRGGEGFIRQLCWRDFYHQLLAARPEITSADYRPRRRGWHTDEAALEAWREGLTGYPIVDAGMRQLQAEGYMHNRARLIVGSFLTKILCLDWRSGAKHFAGLLADADVANNIGNWQWVAGTGTDTRPNRVLSPLRQAARFDPSGEYVRRWVPELGGVAGAAVHRPWGLGRGREALRYPEPIVDYAAARAAYLAQR